MSVCRITATNVKNITLIKLSPSEREQDEMRCDRYKCEEDRSILHGELWNKGVSPHEDVNTISFFRNERQRKRINSVEYEFKITLAADCDNILGMPEKNWKIIIIFGGTDKEPDAQATVIRSDAKYYAIEMN
ncbi:hypothetical protein CBL_08556 [Carabus blaptoides fortunei]